MWSTTADGFLLITSRHRACLFSLRTMLRVRLGLRPPGKTAPSVDTTLISTRCRGPSTNDHASSAVSPASSLSCSLVLLRVASGESACKTCVRSPWNRSEAVDLPVNITLESRSRLHAATLYSWTPLALRPGAA
eukprot:scaffold3444_cov57-Phaeocystis_antarctica.AAC.1